MIETAVQPAYLGRFIVHTDSPIKRLVKAFDEEPLYIQTKPTLVRVEISVVINYSGADPDTFPVKVTPILQYGKDGLYHTHIYTRAQSLGAIEQHLDEDTEVRDIQSAKNDDLGFICCYVQNKALDTILKGMGPSMLCGPGRIIDS